MIKPQLTLKRKFFFIFMLGALLIVFIAGIGLYGTIKSRNDIKKLYEAKYGIINDAAHIRGDILDARVELVTMFAEKDLDKKSEHKERIELLTLDALADYDVMLKNIVEGDKAAYSKLADAKAVWDEFRSTRDNELIPLILDNRIEKARELTIGMQQQRFNNIMRLFNEAMEAVKGHVEKQQEEIDRFGRRILLGIGAMMLAGFISGIFIMGTVSGDMVRRIDVLSNAHKELIGGMFEERVELEGNDEITSLASGFNVMARQLYEDRIAQEQYAKVLKWNAENNEKRSRELEEKNKELLELNKKLQDTQSHLVQSEKMASIGQLAAGVAHEINNPMGFISSNMNTLTGYSMELKELLGMYNWLDAAFKAKNYEEANNVLQDIGNFKSSIDFEFVMEDLNKLIAESKDGIERVRTIIKGMKDFSHVSETEKALFDVNEGLESTLHIVWNELKYKAVIEKEYGDVPKIICFPQQINQVFMNILVNAAQAIDGKGEIKIKTFNEKFMSTPGGWVVVEISDTGSGMTDDVKQKIFDPFFTTKPVGSGTGLGLSIAHGIIQRHNGSIDVESKIGKGTKFIIRLPAEVNVRA